MLFRSTSTTTCPPSAPATMTETVGVQWLNTPTARPLTEADHFEGDEMNGAWRIIWAFTR